MYFIMSDMAVLRLPLILLPERVILRICIKEFLFLTDKLTLIITSDFETRPESSR